jgi:redox-sensitive bicupin YhaK (pirin superfamily)
VTLVAGALEGVALPAPPPSSYASKPESDVAIWTIRLAAGASWTLPPAARGSSRFLYFFSGRDLHAAGTPVPEPALVVVDPDAAVRLEAAASDVEILLLQGRPIAEPVAQYGPFVMNTRAELQQAFADYQRTQFGGWPWGSPDPVNGREGRFARQPDGTVERPGGGR